MERSLDERSFLCTVPPTFAGYFALHRFPVESVVQLDDPAWERAVRAEPFKARQVRPGRRFALQISANIRLPWTFGELVTAWLKRFSLPLELHDSRRPESILSAHFQVEPDSSVTLYSGVSPVEYNLSPWSRGVCRIPRDPDAVSRAEQKLEEGLELLSLHGLGVRGGEGLTALDLGAAPGGWSRLLALRGYRVHAVDPADLDPRLSKLPQVQHHRTTAGEFLRGCRERFDLLACDMKMDAVMAARLVARCRERLQPHGAVILTLKLPGGKAALGAVDRAVREMKRAYTIVQARQLYFNRREVTILATPGA